MSQTVTKGSAPSLSISVSGSTNRITTSGYSYDSNGALTAAPFLTMTYDVENRLSQATHSLHGSERYVYDPANRRVEKAEVGAVTGQTYFYGVEGELLGTYTGGGYGLFYGDPWSVDVHFAGKKIWAGAGSAVLDRLGSSAFWARYGERFYPYGQEITSQGQDFATYPRDTTTDLRYARNRYYSPTTARFTTPDPYRASGGPADPQSWNRYSYVENDPVNFNDPNGLAKCYVEVPYAPPIEVACPQPASPSFPPTGRSFIAHLIMEPGPTGPPAGRERDFQRDLAGARRNRDKIKDALRAAVPGDSVFTTDILDCMAGLESAWDPARDGVGAAAGRTGLLQYNERSWENEFDNILPWSLENAHNIGLNVQVALGGLNARLNIVQAKRPDLKTLEGQMARAITLWGDSKRYGDSHGAAIMDYAKNVGTNFEAACRSIWNLLNP